jgi:hypothetical protein
MYTKKQLRRVVKHAYEMKDKTHETEVVFQIYSDGIYILDTEEDRVIDVAPTEEEAIDICKSINSGEFSDDGSKAECYYKPILIDADSGERVTRANFQYYDLNSEWVKNHIKQLQEYDKFVHGG